MRRLALASIITATALLATGCTAQESTEGPSTAASMPASSAPEPSPSEDSPSEDTTADDLAVDQLVQLCLAAPGVQQDVLYVGPEDGRFERRNDGLWFAEISGMNPDGETVYSTCIIDNDTSEVLSSQTSIESEADPNSVYAFDSAGGE